MVKKSCAYIRLGFCQVITPDMFKTLFDRIFSKTASNLATFWQWFTIFFLRDAVDVVGIRHTSGKLGPWQHPTIWYPRKAVL